MIIGSEVNDDRKIELQKASALVILPVGVFDANGNQVTSFGGASTGLVNGAATVPKPGTAVRLSSTSIPTKRVTIQANAANAGALYYGGSNVSATNGLYLFPTQSATLNTSDLSNLFIDAGTAGDGIAYLYET